MDPVNVGDYEALAEEILAPGVFGYVAGGAGDEWTLRENVRAFGRWILRPRLLVDVETVTAATTVLGTGVSLPVLVAPTAYQRLTHDDGDLGMARAAAAAGTVYCQSTLSSVRPADVAADSDGARWFQLYLSKDRAFAKALLDEASASGYEAVVLTVDLPQAGRRERDIRNDFKIPPDLPLPCISLTFDRPVDPGTGLGAVTDKALTWRDLEWLRSVTHLPLVVKGILTAEDAELACDHGAAGVIVSNHGGRQLDGVGASLDALPEVVDAVAGRAEVFLDGGVRRGSDVLKALALGAQATLVGRAALYGLGAGGEAGVRHVLELLRDEVELGLSLLGCPSPDAVTRAHVAPAPR